MLISAVVIGTGMWMGNALFMRNLLKVQFKTYFFSLVPIATLIRETPLNPFIARTLTLKKLSIIPPFGCGNSNREVGLVNSVFDAKIILPIILIF
jgi:hypothetical protein